MFSRSFLTDFSFFDASSISVLRVLLPTLRSPSNTLFLILSDFSRALVALLRLEVYEVRKMSGFHPLGFDQNRDGWE